MEVNKQYELFRAYNLAIPYNSTNVGLLASYNLETKHIAFDMEKTEYMLLTEDEDNRCSVASSNLCPLIIAVSFSPRPWIDVFVLPEKSNMAVTESDPDPKVRKMSIAF